MSSKNASSASKRINYFMKNNNNKTTKKFVKSLTNNQKKILIKDVLKKADNVLDVFKNIISVGIIISIVFVSLFFKYVTDLESDNCDCSNTFDRLFIKYYSVVFIILQFTRLVLINRLVINTKNLSIPSSSMTPLRFIIIFLNFYYLFVLYKYTNHLRNKDCACSENFIRKLMYRSSYILILILIFIVFVDLIHCILN